MKSLEHRGSAYALGPSAHAAARYYASATDRQFQQISSVDELSPTCDDVVLCTTDYVDARLMQRLCVDEYDDGAAGIICAPSDNELDRISETLVARVPQTSSGNGRRVVIHTNHDLDLAEDQSDSIVGGVVNDETLIRLLSSNASILVVDGNSNGMDISFSARHFGCPFEPGSSMRGTEREPMCQLENRCGRFLQAGPLPNVWDKKSILPLSLCRARVGIFMACRVIRLRDGMIDPAYGLAAALLQQGHFAALAATWRREMGGYPGLFDDLLDHLSAGIPLGVAVRKFNRSQSHISGSSLCVVGDPRVRVGNLRSDRMMRVGDRTPQYLKWSGDQRVDAPGERIEGRLVEEILKNARHSDRYMNGELADETMSELVQNRQRPACESTVQLDQKVCQVLSSYPYMKYLYAVGRVGHLREGGVCPNCGSTALTFRMTFRTLGAATRRITRCPYCDDSEAVPEDWTCGIGLEELAAGRVSVFDVPTEAAVRLCFFDFWSNAPITSHPVPQMGSSRRQANVGRLPMEAMVGQVLISHRLQVGAFAFKLRPFGSETIGVVPSEWTRR